MFENRSYYKFAENMFQPESKYIPEILKYMINDEQADLLVSLPGSIEDISKKLSLDADKIKTYLKDMFRKGLVFKKEKNGILIWRAPAHIAQFHDATIVWPEADNKFFDLWQNYMEKEWPKLAPDLSKFMPRPYTRVIPVGKSIDTGRVKVLSPENVREIIENSSPIAVTKCTCRLTMRKCDSPVEVCLQVNKGASYTIERGSGREISKEEALEIIEKTEKAGLVHVTMNKASIGSFICNCCGCCCQSFTLLISDGVNLCDPSRYVPVNDENLCSLCGTCIDRCWFKAIIINDDQKIEIDQEKCMGCGQCSISCPENAIQMIEKREADFIPV